MRALADLKLTPGQTCFLDRIEGEVATLLLGEDAAEEANVLLRELPEGAREGVYLKTQEDGALAIDAAATEEALADVHSLMEELLGEDAPGPHKR
jgi:hypothetical protein